VLVRVWKDGAFAAAALDAEVSRAVQLEARDRSLATELVYGTLRVLPWLEARIERHATRGLGGLDLRTRAEIVLSAYQLFFLFKVPAFAAVNEAVEAVKNARNVKLASFANAILRKLAAESSAEKGDELLAAAVSASIPGWLRVRLANALGKDGAEAFVLSGVAPPPVGLRLARGARRDEWVQRLGEGVPGATFEIGKASPRAILARGGGKTDTWPGAGEAWFVQEEGSQVVALALGARPGEVVLDACAGRGNKSAIVAEQVMPGGALDVGDVHPEKIARLARELAGSGLAVRKAFAVDWSVGAGDAGSGYDRALVDAPCSGIGTLRRRPDLTLRRQPEDLEGLAALQAAILSRVASRVRPGGRVVYAVCSVLEEEAEAVVARAVAGDARLRPAPFDDPVLRGLANEAPTLRLLPHVHGTDGYFLASLERAGP
jgi:16S rRNA (cytosine967-C5)-methyltransferase